MNAKSPPPSTCVSSRIGPIIPRVGVRTLVVQSLLLLSGLFLVACDRAPDINAEPPEFIYGESTCARCNMIISEPRFAAAYWTTDGNPRRFDDLGEMILHYHEVSPEVASFWVHDYETEEWLKADEAVFVNSNLQTPMGFGTVAFAERAAAETWAAEHDGELLTFEELLARPAEMPMGMGAHTG